MTGLVLKMLELFGKYTEVAEWKLTFGILSEGLLVKIL